MTGPDALLAGKAGTDGPSVHALVIGVSRYDHLPGGEGTLSTQPFARGLTQLGAAASSAARIAIWLRDRLDYPDTPLGSLRFLASPSATEVPLPGGLEPPPATHAEVRAALVAWRDDARRNAANVALLFVAGHGFQIGRAGGIVLLQDFGRSGSLTVMEQTLDVVGVKNGMVNDPNVPETFTPAVQYYFHDACRVRPAASDAYDELSGGLRLDMPKGTLPTASWAYFGARSRDFAYGDPARKTTLFSEAIMHCLDQPEYTDTDGRTILCSMFGSHLEKTVKELAAAYEAQQDPTSEGAGSTRAPVHRRPARRRRRLRGGGDPSPPPTARRTVEITAGPDRLAVEVRGPRGAILADGVTGEAFEVPLGSYDAVIQRPWGGEHVHPFTVGAGEEPLRVDVDLPSDIEPSEPGLRNQPRLERQLRAPARTEDVDRGGASATGWYLRFLSWRHGGFAPLPDGTTPPDVTVDSVDGGEVAMTVRSDSQHLHYVQVRDAAGQSLVSALPITRGGPEAHTCRLYVRAGGGLGAVVRLADGESDRVAGYLSSGRADRAAAIATSAEDLLWSKMRGPLGAAIGGYALLRLGETERMHDWPDNLADWFTWLPDGAVIAGALAARRHDAPAAAVRFLEACRRGMPVFTEGISILVTGIRSLLQLDELPQTARDELTGAAAPLLALSTFADFAALTATLRIDPAWDGFEAEAGWRRFVPSPAPGDPDSFWAEP